MFFFIQYDPVKQHYVPGSKVTIKQFYTYRLMTRENEIPFLQYSGELFHQFLVDVYVKIEKSRLDFLRFNQQNLRISEYDKVTDAIEKDGTLENVGKPFILPSSFTGGPRYMNERAQDAMCYVRAYGRPDLFITFTCNPKWDEIANLSQTAGGSKTQRHDIIARVFQQKLKKMMYVLNKLHVFGETRCFMYVYR